MAIQFLNNQYISGTLEVAGATTFDTVANPGSDTDKFVVINGSGLLGFRTGAELLADIGGSSSATTVTSVSGTQPIISSGGLTPTISLNYTGANNLVESATDLEGNSIATADSIIYNDATDGNVKKGLISDLPFSNTSGTVTSITPGADSGTGTAITTSGTITVAGGSNITTSVSGTTITVNTDFNQYGWSITDGSTTNSIPSGTTVTWQGGTGINTSLNGYILDIEIDSSVIPSGSGTSGKLAKWTGANTLGDGPVTISGNDATFAGTVAINYASGDNVTSGLYVYNSNGAAQIRMEGGSDEWLFNTNYAATQLDIKSKVGSGSTNTVLSLTPTVATFAGDILTNTDSSSDIGKTATRWANIWVDNINGGTPTTGGPYLPLSGGTLTGNLVMASSGINTVSTASTATFTIQSSGANGNNVYLALASSDTEWRWTTNRGDQISGNQGDLFLREDTAGVNALIFETNTGNATFAGDVTANGGALEVYASSGSSTISLDSADATKDKWTLSTTDQAGDAYLRFTNTTLGTTVMSLRDNGNVGIGTNLPDELLHINKAVSAGSDNLLLRIQNPTTATDARVGIAFSVNDHTGTNWDGAYIQAENDGIAQADLTFGSAVNNSLSQHMIIEGNTGYVGIGTNAPATPLDVRKNDSATTALLTLRQLGAGDASIDFQTTTSPYGFNLGVDGSDSDAFKIAVGLGDIGTDTALKIDTSKNATFAGQVNITSAGSAHFGITNTNVSGSSQQWLQYVGSNGDYVFRDATDSRSPLILHGDGNATFAGTVSGTTATFTTFSGDLNGTINTATTAVTKGNAVNDTTVATTAFVQNVVGTIPAGLVFQGTWNASTNTPTLASGSGTTGHFYIVSVAGSTNLDGVTDWEVGDWAVFIEQGASDQWEKIDNSSVLGGSGSGGSLTAWAGSGTSVTLTNAPVTYSGNNTTFAGTIGIGATPTTNAIEIDGADGTSYIYLKSAAATTGARVGLNGDDLIIENKQGSGDMIFDTNSTERMRITSAGNVGIGTASPGYKLVVLETGTAASNVGIDARATGAGTNNYAVWAEGSGASSTNFAFYGATGKNAFLGDTGIGTDSPSTKLSNSAILNAAASGLGTSLLGLNWEVPAGASSQGYVASFANTQTASANANAGVLIEVGSTDTTTRLLSVESGGVNRFEVRGDGNVGIGTTSPGALLHLFSSAPVLRIQDGGTWASNATPKMELYDSADLLGELGVHSDGHLDLKNVKNADIRFFTNNTQKAVVRYNGDVGIGTTSPESLLAVKGGTAVSDLFSISDNTVPTSGAEYGVMMIKTASVEYALNVTAYGLTSKGLRVYNNGALADRTAFEVANAAGTNFVIDGLGNVGIGTGGYAQKPLDVSGVTGGQVLITGADDAVGTTAGILLRAEGGEANGLARVKGGIFFERIAGSFGNGDLKFAVNSSVNNDAVTVADTKMTILSAGNVGIGYTSPGYSLEIQSSGAAGRARVYSDGNGAVFSANGDMQFFTNNAAYATTFYSANKGSSLVRILDSGNVGIGYTSPGSQLSIYKTAFGGDTAGSGGTLDFGVGSTKYWQFRLDSSSSGDLAIDKTYSNVWTTPVSIQRSSGNVGIGTDSPDAKLEVKGNFKIERSSIAEASEITMEAGEFDIKAHSAYKMRFFTGGSERMRIDTSGNVGIGTTSPGKLLSVIGADGRNVTTYLAEIVNNDNTSDQGHGLLVGGGNNANHHLFQVNASGSAVFAIKGDGNVGIGTTSPTATLQVTGDIKIGSGAGSGTDSNNMSIQVSNATYGDTANLGLLVRNNGTNAQFAQIGFGYSESKCPVVIGSVTTSGSSATKGDFIIGTRSTTTGSDAPVERMRVTSAGVVEIGAAAGGVAQSIAKLDVRVNGSAIEFGHTNNTDWYFGTVGSYGSAGNPFISFACWGEESLNTFTTKGAKANIIKNENDGSLSFNQITSINSTGQTPTERMRIDSSGNVGIGNTSPQRKLHVTNSADTFIARFTGGASSDVNIGIFGHSTSNFGSIGTESNDRFSLFTNGTDRLNITNGGNVGIGVTVPSSVLHIKDNTANATQLSIQSNDFSRAEEINFLNPSTSAISGQIKYYTNPTVEYMSFSTSNNSAAAERMRITAAGNVGIGTSAPQELLHLYKTGDIKQEIESLNENAYLIINSGADGVGSSNREEGFIKFYQANNDFWSLGKRNQGYFSLYDHTAAKYVMQFGDNGAFELTPANNITTITGSVGIGTTAPQQKLTLGSVSAGGIQFNYDATDNYRHQILNYWNSSTDSRMDFNIARTSGETPVTIMSVGYDGNVGIGTTAPERKLCLYEASSGQTQIQFQNSTTGAGVNDGFGIGLTADEKGFIYHYEGGDIYMETGNALVYLKNSGGYVGIGTTSPSAQLDVGGSSTNNIGMAIFTESSTTAYLTTSFNSRPTYTLYGINTANTYVGTRLSHAGNTEFFQGIVKGANNGEMEYVWQGYNGTAYQQFGYIDCYGTGAGSLHMAGGATFTGNVGIGTTAPDTTLHVLGVSSFEETTGGAGTQMRLIGTDASGQYNFLLAKQYNVNNTFEITPSTAANGTTFSTPAFVVNSDGKVGIGDVSPAKLLSLWSSETTNTAQLDIQDSSSGAHAYLGTFSNNMYLTFGGTYSSGWASDGTRAIAGIVMSSAAADSNISFQTTATNNAGPTTQMTIIKDGNVGIGTTSPAANLHVVGSAASQPTVTIEAPGSGGAHLRLWDNTSGSSPYIEMGEGSGGSFTRKGFIQMSGNNIKYVTENVGSGAHAFWTTPTTAGTRVKQFQINSSGSAAFTGAVSKASGSFRIDHPLEAKKDTHQLVHSFVEGPQADNIYRGKIDLVDGKATVNIDTEAGMTDGTFVVLNTNIQCFTTNESNWDLVKGSVSGNILTIESKNTSSTATISWLVIGERHDQHMKDTDWTDSDGKVIVEPLKPEDTDEPALNI